MFSELGETQAAGFFVEIAARSSATTDRPLSFAFWRAESRDERCSGFEYGKSWLRKVRAVGGLEDTTGAPDGGLRVCSRGSAK